MTRYALSALADACGLSEHALCVRLGLSGSTMQEARHRGLSERLADRYAVKMGLPAAVVWLELLDEAVDEQTERRREQWRRYAAKRWATDPDHRAARAEYMRRYRADSRAVAAQKRAWREANRDRVREQNREANRRYRAKKNAVSRRRRERLKAS